jgi:hypothetical protein
VPKIDASKNREMGGALDFGGRCLMMAYNNQPRIGGRDSDNGDVRAEARSEFCVVLLCVVNVNCSIIRSS